MTRIIDDVKLDFKDVLILPKRSELDSRSKVTLERRYKFKHSRTEYVGVPVVVANMDHTGTIAMADTLEQHEMGVALHKFYDEATLITYFSSYQRNPHTFYSMGITDDDYNKFENVMKTLADTAYDNFPRYVCIDVANGYSRKFVNYVEKVRAAYPNLVIMAGNVVTPDMTYDLLERGADIVKIGIGPGSVCTTRRITGVGYPQLSAIMECADAAHGANGLICGDGGVTSPGDIAKAFAAGADFVMCGGLFAGHEECEGEKVYGDMPKAWYQEEPREIHDHTNPIMWIKPSTMECFIADIPNKTWVKADMNLIPLKMRFHGMSSKEAMDIHYGGKANYRASEGKAVEVPYKGPVSNTVEEILGGLRSTCTYVGARTLKQLPKCCTFVKVNRILNDVFE